jgi:tetratricopeptide (TPR) repeat protein
LTLRTPDGSVDELLRRGAEYQRAAEHDRAEDCFREALVRQPENADALHLLAGALGVRGYAHQERGELDAAVDCYLESLALVPAQAQIQNNLGNAYRNLGRQEEAIAAFRDAIAADAGLAEGHLNLGTALHLAGDRKQAALHYRAALQCRPDLVQAALNLGHLLEGEGDMQGAGECYRRAIAARPDFAQAHFNYALQLLLAGEYARGWEEYEWRLRLPELQPHWPYAGRPRWDGADLHGKAILLYAEQGFGDALQFARYVPMVAERGGRVILGCRSQLKALFEQANWDCSVVDASEPPPEFDLCCSLLSLPRIFGTTQATIPAQVPYLNAEAGKAARWEARLAADGDAMKVGLVWATEARTAIALAKSLSLDLLGPLAAVPRVIFYSLQKGPAAAEALHAPDGMRLVDVAGELQDFSDTAALISGLDLVVTIDTATAHLAGALGKPVWTLTHWPPDWRWLLGRDDSPWYPAMRLFRRGRTDSWSDVIPRVAQALQRAAQRRK